MAKQYWVGEFLVDLSRNQISHNNQIQTLPPKALRVLTYLAQNRGRVVSYDELLNQVWANSVVTPNTLQRSIAQLRKAFGEDSKASSVIETHAKQGYSLEAQVRWSDDVLAAEVNDADSPQLHAAVKQDSVNEITGTEALPLSPEQPETRQVDVKRNNVLWLATFAALLVLAIGLLPLLPDEPGLKIEDLRYLTATDDKEYGATFSPDGQYILFHRYYEKLCINNLWAKNAETLHEVQLTAQRGTYAGHSLSADGKNLVFIEEQDCTRPVNQNTCYRLMSLDFQAALVSPQQPVELLNCQHSAIKNPTWMDTRHIALMQRDDRHWRIVRYGLKSGTSSTLYEVNDGVILSFSWSAERQLFAVTSIKNDGVQYIETLLPDGSVKSSHAIGFPSGVPGYLKASPQFIPGSDELLMAYRGQLYTLTVKGELDALDLNLDTSIGSPALHPDGKRLLLITGRYDSDVARLSIAEKNADDSQTSAIEPAVFERSINHEDNATFQPGSSSRVAFVSKRTGSEQVWLNDEAGTTLISDFVKGTYIRNMLWDNNGQGLLVLSGMDLYQLSENKQQRLLNFRYPIIDVFAWDSDTRQVIANILVNGTGLFVYLDLNTMEYQSINNKRVYEAAKSPSGPVIFMDHKQQIWQRGAIEDKPLQTLAGHGSEKGFVVDKQWLYGINKTNQLWSYNMHSGAFKILADVTPDIDYLTDVRGETLLATILIAERKEIMELTLTDQK